MRSDDNGNTVLIRSFSGYAKARGELAQYEAKLHKQSYWLELESRRDSVPESPGGQISTLK
jgi:hypothetical protein